MCKKERQCAALAYCLLRMRLEPSGDLLSTFCPVAAPTRVWLGAEHTAGMQETTLQSDNIITLSPKRKLTRGTAVMGIWAFTTFTFHSPIQKRDFSGKYSRGFWKMLCMSYIRAEW